LMPTGATARKRPGGASKRSSVMLDADKPSSAPPTPGDNGAPARNKWLAVASTISWLWAALTVLGEVAVVIPLLVDPQARIGGGWVIIIVMIVLGVVTGVGAFGIRKEESPYNFVAAFACVAWVVVLLGSSAWMNLIGLLINLSVLAIVISQWRRFT